MNEIRVKINGGFLIAGKNPDHNYPGIYICYETENGDIIDIVVAEAKTENGNKDVDVYTYDDVFTEDWKRKFTLKKEDIDVALYVDEFISDEDN